MLQFLALAALDQNEHFQSEHILSQQLHRNNICDLGWKEESSYYNTSFACVKREFLKNKLLQKKDQSPWI